MRLSRLKEWREKRLLTQAELAQRSGIAETTINRIENDRHEPRFSTVRKLAAALDVAAAALMGDEQEAKLAA
jgi:transcriptional regulator with XRE-family HTH domain